MEELNLMDLLKYYLKKSYVIILMTILVALIGYYYVEEIQVPMYHGTTTIILVQKNNRATTAYETQNELTINEKLVSTYSELIKSRRILSQVIQNLKLDLTESELAKNITVTSASDTSIIKITVSDASRKKAASIANQIAGVFKAEIVKIYDLENVTIIDEAVVEDIPYNVNLVKQMIIFTCLGLVLSCGIVFVMYYFDGTVKSKKEVEDKLNLPVLGEVPIAKKLVNQKNKEEKEVYIQNNLTVADEEFEKIDKKVESPKSTTKKTTKTTKTTKTAAKATAKTTKTTRTTRKRTKKEEE